ncbi:MAG: 4-diphosphocytidyl-2C-methyl-D-erythritol kinase [Synergistaceae bacterium]|nr:4-diphosphocytidyl-2C-methyl-D-erythritol kinase [Synergistaceae bacterium]
MEADFDSGRENMAVFGADITGENILTRVCRHIRNLYGEDSLPPVDIRLYKHIPTGSGIGAGSGNAAALLGIFRALRGGETIPGVSSMGADVAFLSGGYPLAFASGIGDALEGMDGNLRLAAVIFFPAWDSDTGRAYGTLDETRALNGAGVLGIEEARDEALSVLNLLKRGERAGRLPNDFELSAGHGDEYAALRKIADDAGALAWGLCGSGSAFFALFKPEDGSARMSVMFEAIRDGRGNNEFQWLRQILVLE